MASKFDPACPHCGWDNGDFQHRGKCHNCGGKLRFAAVTTGQVCTVSHCGGTVLRPSDKDWPVLLAHCDECAEGYRYDGATRRWHRVVFPA